MKLKSFIKKEEKSHIDESMISTIMTKIFLNINNDKIKNFHKQISSNPEIKAEFDKLQKSAKEFQNFLSKDKKSAEKIDNILKNI